jgi:hypothetical protein
MTLASHEPSQERSCPYRERSFSGPKIADAARIYEGASLGTNRRRAGSGIADFSFTPTAAMLGM